MSKERKCPGKGDGNGWRILSRFQPARVTRHSWLMPSDFHTSLDRLRLHLIKLFPVLGTVLSHWRFGAMTTATANSNHDSPLPRELLTLLETVVLAEVSEHRVRKDIETGVYPSGRVVRLEDRRLCFRWIDVYTVAAVYRNHILTGKLRKLVFQKVNHLDCDHVIASVVHTPSVHWSLNCKAVKLDSYLSLDFHSVYVDIRPRVDLYAYGLLRIEEKDSVMGGDAVFRGTRLPVLHVGKMYDRGESAENIREDYPSLTDDDIRFAQLYYRAHPTIGRPRTRAEADGDIPLVG
jgi:uncharacterized protein (DUF433 family)